MKKEVTCLDCRGQGLISKFNEKSAWSERCPIANRGGHLMDIENLIEQLNDWNEKYISNLCGYRTIKCEEYCIKDDCLIVKAATALSTLQAENEKLRAELEQVKRDRDAARSDIETALAYGMKDCELCKNSQCYVRGGTKPCLPKWRGQKEE